MQHSSHGPRPGELELQQHNHVGQADPGQGELRGAPQLEEVQGSDGRGGVRGELLDGVLDEGPLGLGEGPEVGRVEALVVSANKTRGIWAKLRNMFRKVGSWIKQNVILKYCHVEGKWDRVRVEMET